MFALIQSAVPARRRHGGVEWTRLGISGPAFVAGRILEYGRTTKVARIRIPTRSTDGPHVLSMPGGIALATIPGPAATFSGDRGNLSHFAGHATFGVRVRHSSQNRGDSERLSAAKPASGVGFGTPTCFYMKVVFIHLTECREGL